MPVIKQRATSYICARCSYRSQLTRLGTRRHFGSTTSQQSSGQTATARNERDNASKEDEPQQGEQEKGAMSRRLEEMTSESLESNPRRAQKMVEESGFSEELKARLEQRIAEGKFKSENAAAISLSNIPSSADKGARDTAAARPWTGTEELVDSAMRMLEDAHKPLKPGNGSKPRLLNLSVDTRMRQAAQQTGAQRLANARDKTSVYAMTQDKDMSEEEKEEFRKVLKDRFKPGARPMPQSIQGLQSLASERIEDAIARGLFNNIPRGKGVNVERDYTANSPFIDTTEHFMNKIIQKQEVLPPWVEKQQEVTRQATQFRGRLRNDWKRHAARVIASRGGTLSEQIRRAEAYAKAEELVNPRKRKEETISSIDTTGNIQHVTVTQASATEPKQGDEITVTQSTQDLTTAETIAATTTATTTDSVDLQPREGETPTLAAPLPFRDPKWEETELSYHTLALESLNSLTRSYNLMAPELAKKPYFNLRRELNACFADIAPLLPNEIKERARAPPKKAAFEEIGHKKGGVLDRFAGQQVRVYDTKRPTYGFRELWKDLIGRK